MGWLTMGKQGQNQYRMWIWWHTRSIE